MLRFQIKGSSAEPYEIIANKSGTKLTITCTCQGARNKLVCKHRLGLLIGGEFQLAEGKADDVKKLRDMLVGSNLEERLKSVSDLERIVDYMTKNLTAEKKALAREMNDTL